MEDRHFGQLLHPVLRRVLHDLGDETGKTGVDREELALVQEVVVGRVGDLDVLELGVALVDLPGEVAHLAAHRSPRPDEHRHHRHRPHGLEAELLLGHVVGHDADGPVGNLDTGDHGGAPDHGVLAELASDGADLLGGDVGDRGRPLRGVLIDVLLEQLECRAHFLVVDDERPFERRIGRVGQESCGARFGVPHHRYLFFLAVLVLHCGAHERPVGLDEVAGVGVALEIGLVDEAVGDQLVAQRQGKGQVGAGLDGQPVVGEGAGRAQAGVDVDDLLALVTGIQHVTRPGQPAVLVSTGGGDVPPPRQ